MSIDPEDQFIDVIKQTVDKSGFPGKKVALPLAKVQSAAEKKGLDLEMVLSRLKMFGYHGAIVGEKIIFADQEQEAEAPNPMDRFGGMSDMLGGLDLEGLKNMSQEELMGQVSNLMGSMTEEQQQSMMNMYQNMSPEEKEKIISKGKDMGLMQ